MPANSDSPDSRLAELLDLWEREAQMGRKLSAEKFLQEHCADAPEIAARLHPLLQADLAIQPLLQDFENVVEANMKASAESRDGSASNLALTYPDPLPGEFKVLGLLGQGAFGEVWLAKDVHLERKVALKTIRFRSPRPLQAMEALLHEARLLAEVHHPSVMPVYAWRQGSQVNRSECYLILRYVAGGSLGGRLRREGPLDWQLAALYAADVAEGLMAVHAAGVLHRDIKPDNVLWEGEEALLTDFGVAARLADARSFAGTPLYMAPEALEGQPTEASDIYGLAATVFCLVSGQPPFAADTWQELERRVRQGLPEPDIRFQTIPQALERTIRAGLAPDARNRPALPEFHGMLRGALNQAEVDGFARPADAQQVKLRMEISRKAGDEWKPVVTAQPRSDPLSRDIRRVPPKPARVCKVDPIV